jgi:hypothetical protein
MARKRTAKTKLAEKPIISDKVAKKAKKEMNMIIWTVVVLAVVFVASYYIFGSMGKVQYEGLTFSKQMYGSIPIYVYKYNFADKTGQVNVYNFYVRGNPAENNVPVSGNIALNPFAPVYLSINETNLKECTQSVIAVAGLSQFVGANQFELRAGVPDKAIADATNGTYVNCGTNSQESVILVESGDKTQIVNQGNCYIIDIANCEILPALEKFEIQSVADAKARMKTQ